MARIGAGAALIAALTLAVAAAQTLPRLHVSALGMHADRKTVVVGAPFHVTIHVHVTESPERLDELMQPVMTNAVEEGTEQRRVATADGTDFYETLTVSAQAPGEASFTPAYIDAIDPRTGQALRFSSDAVRVAVTAGSPFAGIDTRARVTLLGALIALIVALVVLPLLAWGLRRRRSAAPASTNGQAPASHAPLELPSDDPLRDAIALVRARGDDASMDMLRVVLFARAGVGSGATLADAMHELGDREPLLIATLHASERARFGPAADRPAATRELLRLLYAYASGEGA